MPCYIRLRIIQVHEMEAKLGETNEEQKGIGSPAKVTEEYLQIESIAPRKDRNQLLRDAVLIFVWNRQNNKVFQKTMRQWGLLVAFYIGLYFIVVGIWFATWMVFWNFGIDFNRQSNMYLINKVPSVHIYPKMDNSWSRLLYFNRASYTQMYKLIHKLSEKIDTQEISVGVYKYIDCSPSKRPTREESCNFDTSVFGDNCYKYKTFELDAGTPCWIFGLNSLRQWIPDTYRNVSELLAHGFPAHQKYNQVILDNFDSNFVPISCQGNHEKSLQFGHAAEIYDEDGEINHLIKIPEIG